MINVEPKERKRREEANDLVWRPLKKANACINLALEEYLEGNNQRTEMLIEYAIELLREVVVAATPMRRATSSGQLGAPISSKKGNQNETE